MILNKFFKTEEFECKCGCGQCIINDELIRILTDVRTHFGSPVTVTSGNRCVNYNAEVGGSERSQHLYGTAADIVVKYVSPEEVHAYIEREHRPGGLGRYTSFTHVDTRQGHARWNG